MREAFGGRARRIGSGESLDAALAEQLGIVAAVEPPMV
jgi:hypothetical protein